MGKSTGVAAARPETRRLGPAPSVDLPGVAPGLAPCKGALRPHAQARLARPAAQALHAMCVQRSVSRARAVHHPIGSVASRRSHGGVAGSRTRICALPARRLACWTTTPWWTCRVTLPVLVDANDERSLLHKPMAGPEGIEPSSAVLEAALRSCARTYDRRPVRGLNPSHRIDSAAATPVASRGIRTAGKGIWLGGLGPEGPRCRDDNRTAAARMVSPLGVGPSSSSLGNSRRRPAGQGDGGDRRESNPR
jgi:hypothetical protein